MPSLPPYLSGGELVLFKNGLIPKEREGKEWIHKENVKSCQQMEEVYMYCKHNFQKVSSPTGIYARNSFSFFLFFF
jgi:hypothetical protein